MSASPGPAPPVSGATAARARGSRRRRGLLLALLLPLAAACSDEGPEPVGPVPGLPPTILGVESDGRVLEVGGRATIRGLNFSPEAERNEVRVGSMTAGIARASPTALDVRLPAASGGPCRPAEPVPVRVTVAGRSDSIRYPLSVASRLELAPGRDSVLPRRRIDCRELDASGARYLISVINTSRSGADLSPLTIEGALGAETAGARASAGPPPPSRPGPGRVVRGLDARPALQTALRGRLAHRRVMREMSELSRRLGAPALGGGRGTPARASGLPSSSARRAPEPGDLRTFRVPDIFQACSDFTSVTGRVVHVTEHAVVVEDTANPLAGGMDEHYRDLGREFEDVMWPVIEQNYGSPLVLDDRLDGDGRLVMLFTERVNEQSRGLAGTLLGFVALSDFFPRESPDPRFDACAASDTAEIFYARVPTSGGSDPTDISTPPGWKRQLRATVIHEVKHLSSYAARVQNALDADRSIRLESTWLEEATAHVAEELYARRVFGYGQGDDTGFEESVRCELRVDPSFPECAGAPLAVYPNFANLALYLGAVDDRSMLRTNDLSYRGAGWWFLRWALDHAPTPESDVLRALNGATATGIENLEARMGRSYESMLVDFLPALAADDWAAPDGGDPALSVPSWDTRDVFAGLHRVLCEEEGACSLFDEEFPLRTVSETYGSFTRTLSVRGGSGAFVHLRGSPGGAQLLRIRGTAGGGVPADLEISVLRVR